MSPRKLPSARLPSPRRARPTPTQGGKEATRSNALLHKLIVDAVAEVAPGVGRDLIGLVTSRDEIDQVGAAARCKNGRRAQRVQCSLSGACAISGLAGRAPWRVVRQTCLPGPLRWSAPQRAALPSAQPTARTAPADSLHHAALPAAHASWPAAAEAA